MSSYPPPPYGQTVCPAPPYNATNFTSTVSTDPATLSTINNLISYASTQPQYPWNTGSNAQQIYRSQQNISLFNFYNQQTSSIKAANMAGGSSFQMPYPQFKTQAERIMYIQGMSLTSARNQITGKNPSAPAGVPCSTIYEIINYSTIS